MTKGKGNVENGFQCEKKTGEFLSNYSAVVA